MDFWRVPCLLKGCRADFKNGPGVTRIVVPYWAPSVYLTLTQIMAPPQAIPILCQIYICSSLIPMVSWWVPYLPKGCSSDFNNGLGGDSNSGPVLAPRSSFVSNSNNGPSPGHSNLVSDEVYISVQVSYL